MANQIVKNLVGFAIEYRSWNNSNYIIEPHTYSFKGNVVFKRVRDLHAAYQIVDTISDGYEQASYIEQINDLVRQFINAGIGYSVINQIKMLATMVEAPESNKAADLKKFYSAFDLKIVDKTLCCVA